MSGSQIRRDASSAAESDRKVIPFRPRTSVPPPSPPGTQRDDLATYEQGPEPDDYHHRMMMNVAAGIFTIALTGFGIWLALSIADLRKTTHCPLVRRRHCA